MISIENLSAKGCPNVMALLLAMVSLAFCATAWSDEQSDSQKTASATAAGVTVGVEDTESSSQTEPNPDAADVQPQYLIGVQCFEADSLLRQHLKLGDRGLIVQDLISDSPASRSGLTIGDLIVSAGDRHLRTVHELMKVIQESNGLAVELSIIRAGEPMTISVVPQKRSQPEQSSDDSAPFRQFHPGIVINRESRAEDAHEIIEQALKAAGMNSAWQLTPHHPNTPLPSATHAAMQQEITALHEQIRLLTDRITALEKNQPTEVRQQQPLSSPSESRNDKTGTHQ